MALPAGAVWEIRQNGNDINGGGFNSARGGTDFTLQTAAQVNIDNAAITATCNAAVITFTGGTKTVASGEIGNVVHMVTGTGLTAGWYEITAVSTGLNGTWTLDRTTNMSGGAVTSALMGGAMASPGAISGAIVNGNVLFLKYSATPYSVTSSSAGASGIISQVASAILQGYDTTRTVGNTDSNLPAISYGVASVTYFGGNNWNVNSVSMDGNSQTSARLVSANVSFTRCTFTRMNTASAGSPLFSNCYSTVNSATVFVNYCLLCEGYANTAIPFSTLVAERCVASFNTGVSGFNLPTGSRASNCTSVGNGGSGFNANALFAILTNCYAGGNTGSGYGNQGGYPIQTFNCAAYNNTGGVSSGGSWVHVGFVTITNGEPLTDPNNATYTSKDFTPNTTSLRGALLRNVAWPSSLLIDTTSATYEDIGAIHHQDPAGGGGGAVIDGGDMLGGCNG